MKSVLIRTLASLVLLSATGPALAKMASPAPPKALIQNGIRYETEIESHSCSETEKNPGHDVYAVAKNEKSGTLIWRTLLWTWVHPCKPNTISGKPVALGYVGVLPVRMKLDKNLLQVFSNYDQDFKINRKDGTLMDAPASVYGTEGP